MCGGCKEMMCRGEVRRGKERRGGWRGARRRGAEVERRAKELPRLLFLGASSRLLPPPPAALLLLRNEPSPSDSSLPNDAVSGLYRLSFLFFDRACSRLSAALQPPSPSSPSAPSSSFCCMRLCCHCFHNLLPRITGSSSSSSSSESRMASSLAALLKTLVV